MSWIINNKIYVIPVVWTLEADQVKDIFARGVDEWLLVVEGGELTLGGDTAVKNGL